MALITCINLLYKIWLANVYIISPDKSPYDVKCPFFGKETDAVL